MSRIRWRDRLLRRTFGPCDSPAACLDLGLILLSLLALEEPVRRVAGLYGSGFRLEGPGLAGAGVIAGAGAVLGWLGSWISATRNMRRIEPGN